MQRGDIYSVNLGNGFCREQGGFRPAIIIQNDKANKHGNTFTVVCLTTACKKNLPTHLTIKGGKFGLNADSTVLVETIRTIDKHRFYKYIGRIDEKTLEEIDRLLKLHLNLS